MALSIGFRVSVSLHPAIQLRGVWLLPRRDWHPLVAPAFLWTRDHLVCPQQHRLRNRQPECLRGLEIDDQLELRRLLDGEISRPGSFENLGDILGGVSAAT